MAKNYSISNYLADFNIALGRTTEAVAEMGRIYFDAINHYPNTARKEFAKKFPQIRDCTWQAFEQIGAGKLNASAFFLRVAVRNEVAALPIDCQDKIFSTDCPSFKVVEPSTLRARTVNLADIDANQAKVLFDKDEGRVRSVDEQKTYVKNNPAPVVAKNEKKAKKYEIVGERVVIGGIKFTLDELDAIRNELYEKIFG